MQRELRIQLGRVWMAAEDVAHLTVGSRMELDSPPDGEAELYVGARRFARGEPAVMDGTFCFRVSAVTASAGPEDAADRGGRQEQEIELMKGQVDRT